MTTETTTDTTTATTVDTTATTDTTASAFAATGDATATTETVVPLAERIPEKLRVMKEDGTFDLEASTAKLAEGYGNLEKRLGTGDAPPKDPESYDPKPERFDMEALKADEQYKGWLKGAHAKGMTNDQVAYVLDSFADRQADIAPNPLLMPLEDFKTAVEPAFAEYGGFQKGIALGQRTIRTFVPDVTAEDLASIPHHPLIAKVLAAVGKELPEDTGTPRVGALSATDFDSEVATLKASEAFNNATHPEHQAAVDKMSSLYARRYGTTPQKLGAGAVVIHN